MVGEVLRAQVGPYQQVVAHVREALQADRVGTRLDHGEADAEVAGVGQVRLHLGGFGGGEVPLEVARRSSDADERR
jgi:hypothetical protein